MRKHGGEKFSTFDACIFQYDKQMGNYKEQMLNVKTVGDLSELQFFTHVLGLNIKVQVLMWVFICANQLSSLKVRKSNLEN